MHDIQKKIQKSEDLIKVMDDQGHVYEIPLSILPTCVLERWISHTRVPGNIVLGKDAQSQKKISALSRHGMVFKILK
jgi:hypothetical protein